MPLTSMFSFTASSAQGSRSVPTACFAPSFRLMMDRMPLPVPTSSSTVSGVRYLRSWRMHSWVVSCMPVPKAVPGSIWIRSLSRSSGCTSSQEGLIRMSST